MPGHGLTAVVDLGQVVVVGPTHQGDPCHGLVAAMGERMPVVELEPVACGASSALLG